MILEHELDRYLLAAADAHSNPMFGWIVRLALATGMRSSEIRNLKRKQVDLPHRLIHLQDTKNGNARIVSLSCEATRALHTTMDNPVRPSTPISCFSVNPCGTANAAPANSIPHGATSRSRPALPQPAPRSHQPPYGSPPVRSGNGVHQRAQIHANVQAPHAPAGRGLGGSAGCC